MTTNKPREFWITRHPESTHPDKLTYIVLHEYYADKNPLHVVEASALEAERAKVQRLVEGLKGMMNVPELKIDSSTTILTIANHVKYHYEIKIRNLLKEYGEV